MDASQDLRYAARALLKTPAFTVAALLTLALGIGANTAMFTVIDTVLLRPLPYREPERLVAIFSTFLSNGIPQSGSALPDLREIRDQSRSLEQVAGYYAHHANLTGQQEPEWVQGVYVSPALFELLGVQPALGRAFRPEEEILGRHRVAILSHGLWQRRFGGRSSVIGESFSLNGETYTVAGVMPAGFAFPSTLAQLWAPISFAPSDAMGTRANHFINAIARLKPGVSVAQARTEVQAIFRRLETQYQENAGLGGDVTDYVSSVLGNVQRPLVILVGAVAFVLLIACANVANLLLARAAARHREITVRAALGASRGRLVRQLLTESLLLAALGASLGLLVASWALDLIRTLGPTNIPRLQTAQLDARVLLFTGALSLLASIVFGLVPALDLSSLDLSTALKEAARSSTGGARRRHARNALVIAEVALSLVLAIGAGLLIQTLIRLQKVDPGFQPQNVLTMQISLPPTKYPDTGPSRISFYNELIARIERIPEVKAVGASTAIPLAAVGWGKWFTVEDRPASRLSDVPLVQFRQVTPNYFRALGIPLRSGRYFTEDDAVGRPPVMIVNEALARRFWPNESPLGKRVFPAPPEHLIREMLPSPDFRIPRMTVVGVVADVKQRGLGQPPMQEMYVPYIQGGDRDMETPAQSMFLVVKTTFNPGGFAPVVRQVVHSLDPEQPVSDVRTMEERMNVSLLQRRFNLFLLGAFAALALLLAAIGIYGVMSYSVSQRTQEIGIRMALGARGADVRRMVLAQGMLLASAGVALGAGIAIAVTRVMSALLFEVKPTDSATFVAAAALLLLVSLLSCYLPAARATRVDPLNALRHQ